MIEEHPERGAPDLEQDTGGRGVPHRQLRVEIRRNGNSRLSPGSGFSEGSDLDPVVI